MIIYYLNTSLFKDIMNKFFPEKEKEDREYCAFLQKAITSCRENNKPDHAPCKQIEELLKTLKC